MRVGGAKRNQGGINIGEKNGESGVEQVEPPNLPLTSSVTSDISCHPSAYISCVCVKDDNRLVWN